MSKVPVHDQRMSVEVKSSWLDATYWDVRPVQIAHVCIQHDQRMRIMEHPEVFRLLEALRTGTAVEVNRLPGRWLVANYETDRSSMMPTVTHRFDLKQAREHRDVHVPFTRAVEREPESPEKQAARRMAKRILGYDPNPPPDDCNSYFSLDLSFANMAEATRHLGVSAAEFKSKLENSVMPTWEVREKGVGVREEGNSEGRGGG